MTRRPAFDLAWHERVAAAALDGAESQTCQVVKAVIRIETSSPGSSTPSLAT